MENLENIKNLIKKLPHSESRVPYTYHHDFLRTRLKSDDMCETISFSRSDIATLHNSNEEELYSLSLIQILDELGYESFICLDDNDLSVIKEAINVGKKIKINGYTISW